jgi:hypothetical protein
MWAYEFEKRRWRSLDKSKLYPPGGYECTTVYVPGTKRLYLFGARGRGQVFSFDVETEQWRDEGVRVPWSVHWGTAIADAKRKRVVLFGGKQTAKDKTCEIGVFYPAGRKFEVLGVKGVKPGAPRSGRAFCHNTRHDLYVLFGGTGKLVDNWVFDPQKNAWRSFAPRKNVPLEPGRKGKGIQTHTMMVYDSKNDLVVLGRSEQPKQWFAMRFVPEKAKWVEPNGAKMGDSR